MSLGASSSGTLGNKPHPTPKTKRAIASKTASNRKLLLPLTRSVAIPIDSHCRNGAKHIWRSDGSNMNVKSPDVFIAYETKFPKNHLRLCPTKKRENSDRKRLTKQRAGCINIAVALVLASAAERRRRKGKPLQGKTAVTANAKLMRLDVEPYKKEVVLQTES